MNRSLVIVAQRHAHPAPKVTTDQARTLSEKGMKQLDVARPGIDAYGPFDLVIASPADRAKLTVARPGIVTLPCPELYFPADGSADRAVTDTVYDRIGNKPIHEHLKSEAGLAFLRWALPATLAVADCIGSSRAERVLVGGHGLYTQLLVMHLALLMGNIAGVNAALTTILAEGDALMLSWHEAKYLACPVI